MIYTSYFAQMKNLPDNYYPVAISQYPPKWYDGVIYKKLAPTPYIINTWNKYAKNLSPNTPERQKWEEWYNNKYQNEVLANLDINKILNELVNITNTTDVFPPLWDNEDKHIVLLCFEKTGDFCHRNLVADWIKEHGIPCREITKAELIKEKDILQVEQLDKVEKIINDKQIKNTNTEVFLDDIDMDIR